MADQSAYDIVEKYHRAWTNDDIDAAMELVADGIFDQLSYGPPVRR